MPEIAIIGDEDIMNYAPSIFVTNQINVALTPYGAASYMYNGRVTYIDPKGISRSIAVILMRRDKTAEAGVQYEGGHVKYPPTNTEERLPTEVPYRANIYALKRMGVKYIFSMAQIGRLTDGLAVNDLVIPDQFIDFTKARWSPALGVIPLTVQTYTAQNQNQNQPTTSQVLFNRGDTFFGEGAIAHSTMNKPVCEKLTYLLNNAFRKVEDKLLKRYNSQDTPAIHTSGTVANIDGPSLPTYGEANMFKLSGCTMVSMTDMPEAKLAREAEIAYAVLGMVNEEDCCVPYDLSTTWSKNVALRDKIRAINFRNAKLVLIEAVQRCDMLKPDSEAHTALDRALRTPVSAMRAGTRARLGILLKRFGGIDSPGGGTPGGGTPGGGTPGGGTGGSGAERITFSTTHNSIYKGAAEIISFYAEGLSANGRYTFDVMTQPPGSNTPAVSIYAGGFSARPDGSYMWEQERLDDGLATARGDYLTWVVINELNLISEATVRSFKPGVGDLNPNRTTNAGGGTAGSGSNTVNPGAIDVNGAPITRPSGPGWWVVPYAPKIVFSSDRSTIFVGTNETMTVQLSGFMASTTYPLDFWFTHPAVNGGAPIRTVNMNITTDGQGSATYRLSHYDDGITPRGVTTNWVGSVAENLQVVSNEIERTFVDGTDAQAKWMSLTTTTSHQTIYKDTSYTHSVVLSGAQPNTRYTLVLRRGQYSGSTADSAVFIHSEVVTTDATGQARMDYTAVYDGETPAARLYQFYSRIEGNNLISTISSVSFVATSAAATNDSGARLFFSSSNTSMTKGESEVLTAALAGYPPNTPVDVQFWNASPALNGGQNTLTYVGTVQIGANGSGSLAVDAHDDGHTVPRGEYTSWIATDKPKVTSNRVTRTFLSSAGQGGGGSLGGVDVVYRTDKHVLAPGTIERHSLVVTGLVPGTSNAAQFFISSVALNNGMSPMLTQTIMIQADSTGRAEHSFINTDDGATPRGAYLCWVRCSGAESDTITRIFEGDVGPSVVFNPTITYTRSGTIFTQGSPDNNTVALSGMRPNTSYSVDLYMQGQNAFGGFPYKTVTVQIVTNAQGVGSWSQNGVDDGITMPRGTYMLWADIAAIQIRSTILTGTWTGTYVPPAPPFNPAISYSTNHSYITQGTTEIHTISLTGMRPSTPYNVTIYAQSPVLWGNVPSAMSTITITTDASGNGQHQFAAYDDGITPRGTYSNWAVIDSAGVSSSTFTRVFA